LDAKLESQLLQVAAETTMFAFTCSINLSSIIEMRLYNESRAMYEPKAIARNFCVRSDS